ncbi:MAG: hypothetical protein JXQ75_22105 [Phycisphaerae bacterium]|nr:hypothetical protein [Phycisphaerae bacterium]
MTAEITHLAFIMMAEVEDGVLRGGLLVTDAHGKPVEFRCTSPIRPNAIQRTLYGGTLMPHIAVELVGAPLVQAVQTSLDVLLVQQEEFLALRARYDKPLLLARRQGEEMKLSDESGKNKPEELLSSPSGKFAPVVVSCHWDFSDDIAQCKEGLGWTFASCDLVEPFERVRRALATLHEQGALSEH